MPETKPFVDVLCVGHACYDLTFNIDRHPRADEKMFASDLQSCGGGPAANAAVAISRLGFSSAFAGYLGKDLYGDQHLQEFVDEQVDTTLLKRGNSPTPLSTILVKPNGDRALINFKGLTQSLPAGTIDFSRLLFKTVLFDGHEPDISPPLATRCRQRHIKTVLDAGSVHRGTRALINNVDYLVCSEKFALSFADNVETALNQLAAEAQAVVITLGQQGLIWKIGQEQGSLPAFSVNAIDSTGAGDAFHGAFAAALADEKSWQDILTYASAAGALCCTQNGARPGLVDLQTLQQFLRQQAV